MKKVVSLLLALTMVFTLCGCGSSKKAFIGLIWITYLKIKFGRFILYTIIEGRIPRPSFHINLAWFSMACSILCGSIPMYLCVVAALLCCKSL